MTMMMMTTAWGACWGMLAPCWGNLGGDGDDGGDDDGDDDPG